MTNHDDITFYHSALRHVILPPYPNKLCHVLAVEAFHLFQQF